MNATDPLMVHISSACRFSNELAADGLQWPLFPAPIVPADQALFLSAAAAVFELASPEGMISGDRFAAIEAIVMEARARVIARDPLAWPALPTGAVDFTPPMCWSLRRRLAEMNSVPGQFFGHVWRRRTRALAEIERALDIARAGGAPACSDRRVRWAIAALERAMAKRLRPIQRTSARRATARADRTGARAHAG